MFKQKWLAIVGVAVLIASMIFSFSVVPTGAAGLTTIPQPQYNHASPPIRYAQVGKPVSRNKPGAGPNASAIYSPSNIQQAYNFSISASSSASGSGQTIAIVDAYGDPKLSSDIATFDSQFGLPSATISISYPAGKPRGHNSGWAMETALDVEWAHANAPQAAIDVIIAPDTTFQSLLTCIQNAIDQGVDAISMSWGAPETSISSSTLNEYETAFSNATNQGIVLLGASGDQGATDGTNQLTTDYPASSPQVIGVGGTSLTLDSSGNYAGETAWSDSGGGYSTIYGEPSYQSGAGITDTSGKRGVPDVAFDADPNTGVYVCSNGLWYQVGGTSVGAPNWAAIVADYASANSGKLDSSVLYGLHGTSDFHDITSGSNGGYTAIPGWDPVTGLGSPDVSNLIGATTVLPTVPAAPQGLTATAGSGQVTLNWSAPSSDGGSSITGYNIYRGTSSGTETQIGPTVTGLTYSDTNVTNEITYYYEVTAVNAVGESSPSNEASATPTSSSTATTVSVSSIGYSTSGGRNHNNNLSITVSLVDNLGNPVANASVSISVDLNGATYASGSGTTGSNGQITFNINHAPSGTYTTTVTGVTASGLQWDGQTPTKNSYTK